MSQRAVLSSPFLRSQLPIMNTTEKENFLKPLRIIHKGLCLGPTVTMVLLNFMFTQKSSGFGVAPSALGVFILVQSAIILLAALFLFKKKTEKFNGILNEENKEIWRGSYIMKWALLEGTVLINTIIYYLFEPNPILIIVALLILLYLYTSSPKLT